MIEFDQVYPTLDLNALRRSSEDTPTSSDATKAAWGATGKMQPTLEGANEGHLAQPYLIRSSRDKAVLQPVLRRGCRPLGPLLRRGPAGGFDERDTVGAKNDYLTLKMSPM